MNGWMWGLTGRKPEGTKEQRTGKEGKAENEGKYVIITWGSYVQTGVSGSQTWASPILDRILLLLLLVIHGLGRKTILLLVQDEIDEYLRNRVFRRWIDDCWTI